MNEISQTVGGAEALTPPKIELIALLSTTNGPSPPSAEDAEVAAKMVNEILSSQSQGKENNKNIDLKFRELVLTPAFNPGH